MDLWSVVLLVVDEADKVLQPNGSMAEQFKTIASHLRQDVQVNG